VTNRFILWAQENRTVLCKPASQIAALSQPTCFYVWRDHAPGRIQMLMSMLSRRRTVLAAAAATALLAACGSDGGDATPATTLQAVHASADAPAVDILVNGTRVASGLVFEKATAGLPVLSGPTRLQVNPANSAASALDLGVVLPPFRFTSAVVVGSVAAGTPAAQALSGVIVEDPGNAPAAGNVKLRVLHGAPAVPAVDIYVSAPTAALPAQPTIPGLAYKSVAPASGTNALEVTSGSYRIRATAAGQRGTIAFDSGAVSLPAGGDLLIVAVPASGSLSPVKLLVVARDGSSFVIGDNQAALRVGHFSPTVPAVDVFLKAPGEANSAANRVLAGVVFPQDSSFLNVPAGSYDASVALAGSLTGVLNLNGASLAKGTSTSVFAIGLLAGTGVQALQLKAFADDRTPVAGKAKVRVMHLSPDAPAVDVVALSGGAIAARVVTNLAYPNATQTSLQLDPGTYTLAVVPTGASAPVLPTAAGVAVTLAAGEVVTIAAVGCLSTTGTCAGGAPFQFKRMSDR
jgi:hypothetical protein